MGRFKQLDLLEGCLVAFSVAIVCANASSSIGLHTIAALFLSAALVPMALYAIIFTNIRASLFGITAIAICLSVRTTDWPAKARFAFSRNEFETIAKEIRNAKPVGVPMWAGSYRVRKIETKKSGAICFWSVLKPSGNTGIVNCPEDKMNFNLWTHTHLVQDWRVIVED